MQSACSSLPPNKNIKAELPLPGNPAIFSSPEKTRGFPSTPCGEFGFLLGFHDKQTFKLLSILY